MSPASISTCRWYSSWLISSAVRALPSCSAAIHTSAASSTIFLPIAWTPASSSATVPDPCGRVAALSVNSAYSWSKVFTKVKVTGRLFCYLPPPTARIADRDHHSHVRTDLALLVKIITCRMWDQAGACDHPAAAPTVEVAMTDLRRTRGPAPTASTDRPDAARRCGVAAFRAGTYLFEALHGKLVLWAHEIVARGGRWHGRIAPLGASAVPQAGR